MRDAFERTLGIGSTESGGAVAIYQHGREVLSLTGGSNGAGSDWSEATRVVGWSCTKGIVAGCVLVASEMGALDVDREVAHYWPEFGQAGKTAITVKHVLTHTAGVPFWDGYDDLVALGTPYGWGQTDKVLAAIAAAPPQWAPGEVMGYHGFTYGWILAEVLRSSTGMSLTELLQDRIATPLGADLSIGSATSKVDDAQLLPPISLDGPAYAEMLERRNDPATLSGKALLNGSRTSMWSIHETANSSEFRSSLAAGGNGLMSARGLARFYGALANGGALSGGPAIASAEWIERHTASQLSMMDLVNYAPNRFALGFQRPSPQAYFGPNDQAFGHHGLGGQVGFADPITGVGFAYVSNQPVFHDGFDPRIVWLVSALQLALD